MSESNENLLRRYLACLNNKDLAGCMACFADGSLIRIRDKEHAGLKAIEAWHTERFGANLRALEPENYRLSDGEASIDFQLTSDRLAGRRLEKLPATLIAAVEGTQFSQAQIKIRLGAGLLNLFGF
ncbi:MAG: nuclear transport factor 2 family protein [Bryobacteraceae bacterium]